MMNCPGIIKREAEGPRRWGDGERLSQKSEVRSYNSRLLLPPSTPHPRLPTPSNNK